MNEKPRAELSAMEEEMKRLRHENQCLREEDQRLRGQVERIRRERDDAEGRCATFRTKVADLEHQVQKQTWRIADLEAEDHAQPPPEVLRDARPPPPAAPDAHSEIIDISDDEDEIPDPVKKAEPRSISIPGRPTLDLKHLTPPRTPSQTPKRQLMHYVHVPESPFKLRTPTTRRSIPVEHDTKSLSRERSSPGRFKRARSSSPPIERYSSSILVDDDDGPPQSSSSASASDESHILRPVSPVGAPPAKCQKQTKPKPKNVKAVKKEVFIFPQAVIDQYLSNTPALEIDPPPRDSLYVPRKFLRLRFGGSDQQFVAHFKLEKGADRDRAVVFPEPVMNPCLPSEPGAPGLIFASRLEITVDGPWALFCRAKLLGKFVWRYMGDYENDVVGRPTPEQFQVQEPEVKQRWGKHISNVKAWPVYVAMRARIALRKAGLPIELNDLARDVVNIRAGSHLPVTEQDIIAALNRGDEAIDIIRMKCVSYDHEFAAELARRYEAYKASGPHVRPPRASKGKSAIRGARARKAPARRVRGDSDWESGSDFSPESEDSDSHNEIARIQPKRKRTAYQDSDSLRLDARSHSPPPALAGLGPDDNLSEITDYGYYW
ncbi:hypothetical protein C8R44DRAFT_808816 [Mycena epipterygia]|nr:hypothetical protein C8R44DRAFT_808816 [Mycena epipterygia]